MRQRERTLTASNIDKITEAFYADLASVGECIQGKKGVPLFIALKREKLTTGPYLGVSLFEAVNRIMSDLVTLKGVAGLLNNKVFPF
jgi:hypothetical protein